MMHSFKKVWLVDQKTRYKCTLSDNGHRVGSEIDSWYIYLLTYIYQAGTFRTRKLYEYGPRFPVSFLLLGLLATSLCLSLLATSQLGSSQLASSMLVSSLHLSLLASIPLASTWLPSLLTISHHLDLYSSQFGSAFQTCSLPVLSQLASSLYYLRFILVIMLSSLYFQRQPVYLVAEVDHNVLWASSDS